MTSDAKSKAAHLFDVSLSSAKCYMRMACGGKQTPHSQEEAGVPTPELVEPARKLLEEAP